MDRTKLYLLLGIIAACFVIFYALGYWQGFDTAISTTTNECLNYTKEHCLILK